jgi:Protein of unknown function (DUF2505)
VATSLSVCLDIPTDPRSAFLLLCDPQYVHDVAAATGGRDIEVTVSPSEDGGVIIVSVRTLPARLPSYAKALVGEQVHLTETRTLGPADGEGAREGTLVVEFGGAPARVSGAMRLTGDHRASGLNVDLQVKASVPLVGGRIERLTADQIEAALRKEEQVASTRAR